MKYKFLTLCSIILLFLSACNTGGKSGLLVPKDAALVLHLDLASLSSKLSWDEIKQTEWFKKASEEANKEAKDSVFSTLLNDPAVSGIDTKSSLVFFMKTNGNYGYAATIGSIKNKENFTKVLQDAGKGKVSVVKDGDYSNAVLGDEDNAVLYFNDKNFVFIVNTGGLNVPKVPIGHRGGYTNLEKYSLDSLKIFAKNTFSLKGKDLLDADTRFAQLINDKADAHYWINSGALYGGSMMGMMSMMKFSTLLNGTVSTGKMNFENGKLTFDQKTYYGKEMTDFFKKYNGKKLDNQTLSKLPETVLFAMALNYSPEGLKEFIKLLGVDGIVNAGLAQIGFSADEFVKANKGDLVFALSGINFSKEPATVVTDDGHTYNYQKEKSDIDFVFGTSVNDKAAFEKMNNTISLLLREQLKSNDSTLTSLNKKIEGDWFGLASDQASLDKFFAKKTAPSYAKELEGHSGGFYVDFMQLINNFSKEVKDSSTARVRDLSRNFWKDMVANWDVKDGELIAKVDINLQDTKTNFLKQLNMYIDGIYKAKPSKNSQAIDRELVDTVDGAAGMIEGDMIDTAVIAPPAAEHK